MLIVPTLVPSPSYEHDTPEVHEFYDRLKSGLQLTIAGEIERRHHHLNTAEELAPEVQIAARNLEVAESVAADAANVLKMLLAGPMPRQGLKSARDSARQAASDLTRVHNEFIEATSKQGRESREVTLRTGASRGLARWQFADRSVGPAPFGVYAFYDFDGRALYVGKTTEGVSVRIRRHLTNQRTDAVAMSVLDPLEVVEVEVWPFWPNSDQRAEAKIFVDALEFSVEQDCTSHGWALFNEKRIIPVDSPPALPASVRFDMLSEDHRRRLGHPDLRIARRLAISARLSSRIAERSLKHVGLRRSLHRQLVRLQELTDARFAELGGEAAVPEDRGDEDD